MTSPALLLRAGRVDVAEDAKDAEDRRQGFLTGDEHWLGGQAIELEGPDRLVMIEKYVSEQTLSEHSKGDASPTCCPP